MILFLYPFASVSHPKARHGRSAIQQLSYPDGSSAILAVSYTDGHTDHIAVQLPRRQISSADTSLFRSGSMIVPPLSLIIYIVSP
ncbi:unnamed protein product [Macrosiphum euphorbiae]|uniref:Uncharacterized protein n=1 Tax=Macrosiphum euphorbiae TaxID=13131 RepID=A0AAV0VYM9_9HEMI|nr:unnamed protein product [Macrosiphum euphorbiae]CAI6373401.1 unnamed protein product [Macrosiphum euphorbiae]